MKNIIQKQYDQHLMVPVLGIMLLSGYVHHPGIPNHQIEHKTIE